MKYIKIAFIVEGKGEIAALPVLVRRILQTIDETVFVGDKTNPIIVGRNTIVKPGELERYVGIAAEKVGRDGGILILMDADDDCPAQLAVCRRELKNEHYWDFLISQSNKWLPFCDCSV